LNLDLNLFTYKELLKISSEEGKTLVYDSIRKKKVILTPEEMTRQLIVHFLTDQKGYRKNLLQLEKKVVVNGMARRYDLVAYDSDFKPFLLLECKSHKVPIKQKTIEQVSAYNLSLQAPYLLICNGYDAYCYGVNHETEEIIALDDIPHFIGN
jgi:hypothetical protein